MGGVHGRDGSVGAAAGGVHGRDSVAVDSVVVDGAVDGTVWPWTVCCGLWSHSLALIPGRWELLVEESLCGGSKVVKT